VPGEGQCNYRRITQLIERVGFYSKLLLSLLTSSPSDAEFAEYFHRWGELVQELMFK
jgi:hypothetical protein